MKMIDLEHEADEIQGNWASNPPPKSRTPTLVWSGV